MSHKKPTESAEILEKVRFFAKLDGENAGRWKFNNPNRGIELTFVEIAQLCEALQARNAELEGEVKRMGEALKYIAPTGYHLGLSIVWCEEDEPVSARMAMEALASLSPQSRALVDSPKSE